MLKFSLLNSVFPSLPYYASDYNLDVTHSNRYNISLARSCSLIILVVRCIACTSHCLKILFNVQNYLGVPLFLNYLIENYASCVGKIKMKMLVVSFYYDYRCGVDHIPCLMFLVLHL